MHVTQGYLLNAHDAGHSTQDCVKMRAFWVVGIWGAVSVASVSSSYSVGNVPVVVLRRVWSHPHFQILSDSFQFSSRLFISLLTMHSRISVTNRCC